MNKLSKKLVLSILTLVLTVVALGANTYAWFTLGNNANTGEFTATIEAGEGLEIQLVGDSSWYNELPAGLISEKIKGVRFAALTSVDGINLNNITGAEAAAGTYVEFQLKFRSLTQGNVYLTDYSLTGEVSTKLADINFQGVNGAVNFDDAYQINSADAARISVLGKNQQTLSTTAGDHEYGFAGAHSYYDVKNSETLKAPLDLAFEYTTITENGQNVTTVSKKADAPKIKETLQTADTNVVMVELSNLVNGFYEGQLTVKVWIEGWDVDAFNAILGLPINVTLSFEKK